MQVVPQWNSLKTKTDFLQATGDLQMDLHQQAAETRNQVFGRKVFVRAVVEVSNFCRENCQYCGMRRSNRSLSRYRLELDELRRTIFEECPDIVTDINLQTGEDPVAVREIVIPLVREIKASGRFGISVCLGTLSESLYRELYEAGAHFYIMKLESGNPEHYKQMEAPGTFNERIENIRHLASTGWNVSSGIIIDLPGQNDSLIAEALQLMESLPLAGCSVSPFIPGDQTPLASHTAGSLEKTLNALALMRLASPDRIIPAVSAMTLVGDAGYSRAITAGANLTTINLTPTDARENYVIYKSKRNIMTHERILREVEHANCEISSVGMGSYLA